MKLLVAVTGASGIPLAVSTLEALKTCGIERHLIVSKNALSVQRYEQKAEIDWESLCERRYAEDDLSACLSSGSYPIDAMVVVPCSMNTLAHIANGLEHNLITRAASVNLKQERPVVLVPRETPLSLIHLENMRKAKLAGCSILPPTLTFYFLPSTIQEMCDHIVGKILEVLGISHHLYPVWDPSDE